MQGSNKYYVGLDVSSKETAICIVDYGGNIIHEAMVSTEPLIIGAYLKNTELACEKIGIEANNLAIWLYWKLTEFGYPIICVETHQTSAFMSAQKMKTDKNDARGIAQMMRCDMYRKVHVKSDESQRLKMIVNNRRFMVEQRVALENQIRGSLKTFGLIIGTITRSHYESRVRELIDGDGELETAVLPLLEQRCSGMERINMLDKLLVTAAKNDPVCRLLMTAPGVGPLTAILYKAVIDDPTRFKYSKDVAPHLGLVPRKYASGEVDFNGGITKAGDTMLRQHLYTAAETITRRPARPCKLKTWGRALEKRSSYKVSRVAVARKLSILLHRMWVDGTEFDWGNQNRKLRTNEHEVKMLEAA